MKKYLPLLGGVLSIFIILLLPMRHKLFALIYILIGIPFITYQMREKGAGDRPYHGGLQGGVIGGFIGALLDYIIMNLINDNMAKYNIRIDLLLGFILGASIGSSLGIIAGGRFNNKKETDDASRLR